MNKITSIIVNIIVMFIALWIIYAIFSTIKSFWLLPVYIIFAITILRLLLNSDFLNNYFGVKYSILNLIAWIFLFSTFSLLKGQDFSTFIVALLVGTGLYLFTRNSILVRVLGFLVLLFTSFYSNLNINFLKDKTKEDKIEYVDDEKDNRVPETENETVINEDKDTLTITYLKHRLNWKDNSQLAYKANLKVRKDKSDLNFLQRNQFESSGNDFTSYFRKVYFELLENSRGNLDKVANEYYNIGVKRKLNRAQFADMIVSSIQNIPYYLVHDLSHKQADEKYGGFIAEYHQTGKPCLENTKYGLLSPTEFMGSFKGDCDTRSLFLFYILSKFKYKVALLGSEAYGHAIIGISGNYSGDFIKYDGLKYYVWETTATGFVPGTIAPEISNMNNWDVILTN